MAPYQYSKLDDETTDIRLIKLLPGDDRQCISLQMFTVALIKPPERALKRLSLAEVQQTLPPGWTVFETVERRYLFENDDTAETFWAHPLAHIDPSSYELPAEDGEPSTSPKYEALSYTWGSPENPETAFIESYDGERYTIQLQQNLASALRHVRSGSGPRLFWIDAICINQSDVLERNIQVTRMGDIYRLADRVVVWLGPESSNSKLAFSTLEFVGAQLEITRKNSFCASPTAEHKKWYHSTTKLPYGEETLLSILQLLRRPWFDRVWVTQEIQLASFNSIIQCGPDEIAWPLFRRGVSCIINRREMPWPEFSDRAFTIRPLVRYTQRQNFFSQLLVSRNRICANPRDKVYGVLGLASEKVAATIRPKYSLPVSSVYRDTFLLQLEQMQRLDALINVDRTENPEHQLPSWVPDWSRPIPGFAPVNGNFVSGVSSAQAVFIDPNILQVAGVHCATVSAVHAPIDQSAGSTSEGIREWAPETFQAGSYPTGEPLIDAFAAILVDNCTRDRYPAVSLFPYLHEVKAEILNSIQTASGSSSEPPKNSIFLGRMRNRAFLRTEQGYFGLGTRGANPGDIVCVLLGCSSMIVLRPVSMNSYNVVGSCYLHGFSDGAALLGPLPSPWKAQLKADSHGYSTPFYHNCTTGENVTEDPRLGAMPASWEKVDCIRTVDDPIALARFKDKTRERVINSDPRLLPEALQERGIKIQVFELS